jgi:cation diffusion facilitator family transporter
VLVWLVLVRATGQPLLDPAVALIVVVLIVRTASGTMRKAVNNLMDIRLPEHEENAIRAAIEGREDIANYHALRTRKAGNQRHVVVHIVVPRDKTVEQGHQIAEDTENDIRALFPGAAVTIHVEPCTPDCAECPAQCDAPPGRSDPR